MNINIGIKTEVKIPTAINAEDILYVDGELICMFYRKKTFLEKMFMWF